MYEVGLRVNCEIEVEGRGLKGGVSGGAENRKYLT